MNISLFIKYLEINGHYLYIDDNAEYIYKCNTETFLNENVIHYTKNTSLQQIIYGNKIYMVMHKVGISFSNRLSIYCYLCLFDINIPIIEEHRLFYNNYLLFEQKYLSIMLKLEKELIESRLHPKKINKWLESNKDKDVDNYEYLYAVG